MSLARTAVVLLASVGVVFALSSLSFSADPHVHLDPLAPGSPAVVESEGFGCGDLLLHATEHHCGYAWQYGGVVPPEYGSFAECYSGEFEICSAVFGFTQIGGQHDQTMDVYIWDDASGEPGAVLCMVSGVDPGPIAFHPSFSLHVVPLEGCCLKGHWWVGFWPNWPGELAAWYCAEDLTGFGGGCPMTKIAPGLGFPTGWQNVSMVWGPTQDMWIGAEVRECGVVPAEGTSWGRVKALYGSAESD